MNKNIENINKNSHQFEIIFTQSQIKEIKAFCKKGGVDVYIRKNQIHFRKSKFAHSGEFENELVITSENASYSDIFFEDYFGHLVNLINSGLIKSGYKVKFFVVSDGNNLLTQNELEKYEVKIYIDKPTKNGFKNVIFGLLLYSNVDVYTRNPFLVSSYQ